MSQDRDPLGWCALIAFGFLALCWYRLGLPSTVYFDETHYIPAARKLLQLEHANREHPLFAKEIFAASIALFGDRPLVWRIPSTLAGAAGLFALGRLVWLSSRRRFATISAMVLFATNFTWFVQSRIAMLDIFAISLGLIALWQFAAALGLTASKARWRLAATGVALGLAMGSKWSIVPIAVLPGLTFLWLKVLERGRSECVREISLVEAGIWLGLLPLLVYWATYIPAFFYEAREFRATPFGFLEQHRKMIELQDSVMKGHPYESYWRDWLINRRPIWYLYENIDGAQRGVLFIGNPFTMLAGLPAVLWCLWAGALRKRDDALVLALLYLASLALWFVSGKPVQFYYHYLLPAAFLMGCLAMVLDQAMRRGGAWRAASLACLALAAGLFVWFYPIISAAPLEAGRDAYLKWMWFDSWR